MATNSDECVEVPLNSQAAEFSSFSTAITTETVPRMPTQTSQTSTHRCEESEPLPNTWEYWYTKHNKLQLQQKCRELGLTKVWQTKDKLVDMIVAKQEHLNNQNQRQEQEQEQQDQMQHHSINSHEGNLSLLDENDQPTIQYALRNIKHLQQEVKIRNREIGELNEMLKKAHITINKLSDRISTLEEKSIRMDGDIGEIRAMQLQQENASDYIQNEVPKGTLILGDSNLSKVQQKDLGEDMVIRTLKNANIDLIGCWVEENLTWTPASCILYCGMQDIVSGEYAVSILDSLGALIASLKQRNERMQISVCQVAPTPLNSFSEHIDMYNNKLIEWGDVNAVSVIKCELPFRLGTGEIDDFCFDMKDNVSDVCLNRFGVIRLLSTIASQCSYFSLCNNWNEVKLGQRKKSYAEEKTIFNYNSRSKDTEHQNPRSQKSFNNVNRYVSSHTHPRNSEFRQGQRWVGNRGTPLHHLDRAPPYFTDKRTSAHPREFESRSGYDDMHNDYYRRDTSKRTGCYRCGEFNHHQSNCRFDHKVRCNNCHAYGHKNKLCSYYNR